MLGSDFLVVETQQFQAKANAQHFQRMSEVEALAEVLEESAVDREKM